MEKKVVKRTKKVSHSDSKNIVEKLKCGLIIDRDNKAVSIAISKGFNHHNTAQSRIGKINLHFKVVNLVK